MDALSNNYLRIKCVGDRPNAYGLGTKVTLRNGNSIQYQELTLTRGYQSSVEDVLHFGLGDAEKIDEVLIQWLDGREQILSNVDANQLLQIYQKDGSKHERKQEPLDLLFTEATEQSGVDFSHEENPYDDYKKEILLPHKMSQFGPNLAIGDVDGDGKDDFHVGGAAGQAGALYIQQEGGTFRKVDIDVFERDRGFEDIGSALFDADGDNDLDLYIVSGGNVFPEGSSLLQDRLYENNGKGDFTAKVGKLPEMLTSGSCVVPGDYDGDGDNDLFVGGRVIPKKYPFPPRSYILRNDNGVFTDVTGEIAPDVERPGLVTSAVWSDYNNDNQLDLIVVGEWMPLSIYENSGGQFKDMTSELQMNNTTGWWNRIVSEDFDGDGDMDYVAGNLGWNYKYKANEEEPLHVYCSDFDNSGNLDIVLGYYNQGVCYPVRGRECSSDQMPFIKQKFPNYDAFGRATLSDVYGEDLESALHYEAKWFASSYIENLGEGKFSVTPLPIEAQFSTVFGIIVNDFDDDGNKDLLIAGNFYASEVETGRADAGIGSFMKGNGRSGFVPVKATESGFVANLDVRDLGLIRSNGQPSMILIANNSDKMTVYRIRSKRTGKELAQK